MLERSFCATVLLAVCGVFVALAGKSGGYLAADDPAYAVLWGE